MGKCDFNCPICKKIKQKKLPAYVVDLFSMYFEGKSLRDVAKELNLNKNTIKYYLSKYNFPTRTRKEAMYVFHKKRKGSKKRKVE